jgi:hypothetical protein
MKARNGFLGRWGRLGAIVLDAYIEANPYSTHVFYQYNKPCGRFAHMLQNITSNDKSLSVDIIAEMVARSFSVRDVANDLISEESIRKIAMSIGKRIIGQDGLYLEPSDSKLVST